MRVKTGLTQQQYEKLFEAVDNKRGKLVMVDKASLMQLLADYAELYHHAAMQGEVKGEEVRPRHRVRKII